MVLVGYLTAVMLCQSKISQLKKDGYKVDEFRPKKIGKKTIYLGAFNPLKWLSFIIGIVIGWAWKYIEHIFHQLIIRMYDPYCKENCIERIDEDKPENNGKCINCGCHAISKMLSPFETDAKGHWGKWIWSINKYKIHRDKYPKEIIVNKLY